MEAFVLLLSVGGRGGDGAFLLVLFRESHEKGLVSFRVGAGAVRDASFSSLGGGGGGGNFTGDILPDRP